MNKLYPLHATIGSLLLLGALAACNDKQMCDLPHPHPGRAVLTYDWGTATPRDVQLEVLPYDDPLATPATATHTPADGTTLDRLAPGRYHALAYTEAERLSVSNGTAAVTDTVMIRHLRQGVWTRSSPDRRRCLRSRSGSSSWNPS